MQGRADVGAGRCGEGTIAPDGGGGLDGGAEEDDHPSGEVERTGALRLPPEGAGRVKCEILQTGVQESIGMLVFLLCDD